VEANGERGRGGEGMGGINSIDGWGEFKSGWKLDCGVHGPFSDMGVHPYSVM